MGHLTLAKQHSKKIIVAYKKRLMCSLLIPVRGKDIVHLA